jgi:PAS domain S-box-containing protein
MLPFFSALGLLLHRLRRPGHARAQAFPAAIPAALYGGSGRDHARADHGPSHSPQPHAHHHRRESPAAHQDPEHRAERALRESEDRFRAIFNHAAVGMALCRADSVIILQANRRLADLCGLTQHALIGRTLTELVHPADRGALEDAVGSLCRDEHEHACLELRLTDRADPDSDRSTWLRIHLSCTPAEARHRELAVTAEDITGDRLQKDRLQSQAAELARTIERLERSTRELEDFTYAASHDLKEPIRGLCTFAAFTLEDYGDQLDEPGRERLRAMQGQARRMETLLDALLRFSRYGRHEPARVDFNAADAARRAAAGLAPLIAARNAALSIEPLPWVSSDPDWTAALFEELIQNALTFTDSERPTIRIGARLAEPSGQPVFGVSDDGIGIPERHRLAVFKMFKRLHARGRYGNGVGAGLAIAKRIVERHGGRIWAEPSNAGNGTTIWFTLPGSPDAPPAGAPPVDAPVPPAHPDR